MSENDQFGSFFAGLVTGALAGAIGALLLAPQSGEQTRVQIRDKSATWRSAAEEAYLDLQHRMEKSTTELRGELDKLSARMDDLLAQTRKAASEQIADVSEEVAPEE
jgi:gas vesicle protein